RVDEVFVAAEELVERRILRQVSQAAPGRDAAHGLAGDECLAGSRTDETEQHLQGGGLSRAVGPEQAEDLARAHLERQVRHRTHPARPEADPEGLAQCLRADLGLRGNRVACPPRAGALIAIPRDRLLRSAPLLLGFALLALFFAPTLDPRVQLYYRDTGRLYYPVKLFIAEQLRAGHLPFWDPLTECGISLLGQVTPALLHPATLLYLAFPFDLAFKLNHLLGPLLAGIGAWRLARRLGASPWARLSAAIAYAGCGYVVSVTGSNLPYS